MLSYIAVFSCTVLNKHCRSQLTVSISAKIYLLINGSLVLKFEFRTVSGKSADTTICSKLPFRMRGLIEMKITIVSDAGSSLKIAVHFLGREFMGTTKTCILRHQLSSSPTKAFGINALFLSSLL